MLLLPAALLMLEAKDEQFVLSSASSIPETQSSPNNQLQSKVLKLSRLLEIDPLVVAGIKFPAHKPKTIATSGPDPKMPAVAKAPIPPSHCTDQNQSLSKAPPRGATW